MPCLPHCNKDGGDTRDMRFPHGFIVSYEILQGMKNSAPIGAAFHPSDADGVPAPGRCCSAEGRRRGVRCLIRREGSTPHPAVEAMPQALKTTRPPC